MKILQQKSVCILQDINSFLCDIKEIKLCNKKKNKRKNRKKVLIIKEDAKSL